MQRSSVLFVALLVAMASCGTSPDVPEDTAPVAGQPPTTPNEVPAEVEPAQPLPAPPVPPGPSVNDEAKVGFTGGTRFVVFARGGEASFAVFDRDRGETFRVLGEPMGEPRATYDRYLEMGLNEGAMQWNLVDAPSGRMLVRSVGGVQLVDLGDHGRMIAAWRGTPASASIAPDGTTFAVATKEAMHIVRASDGAFATFAGSIGEYGLVPRWGDANVFWVADDKLTRVERETLKATVFRAPGEKATFAMSSEAKVVAIASDGAVAVYAEDKPASPILRIPTPDVSQLFVEEDGSNVVWVERFIDEKSFTDKGHLHTIDVDARTHVRFAMKNSGCANAPETVTSVKNGKIVSDPSCSIGCPSVRWTHETVTYDAHTGKVLSDTSYTEEQSWNELQWGIREHLEAAAKKLGVEVGELAHHPKEDAVLVERPKGVTLVTLAKNTTSEPIVLERSAGASLSMLTFSSDGAVIAGIVGDRARAWDAKTGRALLR